jgi:hypothetical protein
MSLNLELDKFSEQSRNMLSQSLIDSRRSFTLKTMDRRHTTYENEERAKKLKTLKEL